MIGAFLWVLAGRARRMNHGKPLSMPIVVGPFRPSRSYAARVALWHSLSRNSRRHAGPARMQGSTRSSDRASHALVGKRLAEQAIPLAGLWKRGTGWLAMRGEVASELSAEFGGIGGSARTRGLPESASQGMLPVGRVVPSQPLRSLAGLVGITGPSDRPTEARPRQHWMIQEPFPELLWVDLAW